MQGTILKGIAGFYYVWADNKIYECKARGVFRKRSLTPLVGDKVEISEDKSSVASDSSMLAGVIESISPRLNEFDRPPIANVQTVIIVSAAKDPDPLSYIIDRMAVSAELKCAEIIICINKSDLADCNSLVDCYSSIYPVFCVSVKSGEGIQNLKNAILGKQVALAGPSGVGKSSLTNALLGESGLAQVGDISEKTLRGKNTTRHSELFKGDGFFVFDTPGFTSFDTPQLDENDLDKYFPEFERCIGKCRYNDCTHTMEPDCKVKEELANGKISKSRYESYLAMYKELKERKKY